MHSHQEPVMSTHACSIHRAARCAAAALAAGAALALAACGGDTAHAAGPTPAGQPLQGAARTTAAPESLWKADGSARVAATAQRPAERAYQWSGQRYATREQLAHEELVAAPYTLVIDADDEAAVQSGLVLAEAVHTYAGGKTQLGVFVRSRQPALAARLAERLTHEQGWDHVFVVH
jgi:hypothetical protein